MSFNVNFSQNNSPNNKVYKDLTAVQTFTGVLKDSTSILTPTIKIQISSTDMLTITECNYCVIPAFNNRHYFITDMRLVKNNILEVDLKVDVLSTYADSIIELNGIIKRQENNWNLYLNDGSFKIYQNPIVQVKSFPNGFTEQEFVLSIAGS